MLFKLLGFLSCRMFFKLLQHMSLSKIPDWALSPLGYVKCNSQLTWVGIALVWEGTKLAFNLTGFSFRYVSFHRFSFQKVFGRSGGCFSTRSSFVFVLLGSLCWLHRDKTLRWRKALTSGYVEQRYKLRLIEYSFFFFRLYKTFLITK